MLPRITGITMYDSIEALNSREIMAKIQAAMGTSDITTLEKEKKLKYYNSNFKSTINTVK